MTDTGFILNFLRELQQNNSKAWMDLHREQYLQAKQMFTGLVAETIAILSETDADIVGVTPTDSMFRINKNDFTRKGGSPYKGRMGAGISPGGRHSPYANYILVLEPGGKSRVGGGLPAPTAKVLEAIRQEIDYSTGELESIVQAPDFLSSFGQLTGEKLATAPKGFSKHHPAIDLLKHKSFVALHYFTDEEVCSPNFTEQLLPFFQLIKPMNRFFNQPIKELQQ